MAVALAPAATTWEKLQVNGTNRDIKVHVPDNTPAGASLVIACHGMNQSADWHDSNSKWTVVSDTAKFVLVFPEGIDKGWDIGGNRDVDLVCAIIDKMEKDHGINTSRVYLTGFSMGGMFTYHCANRISDKIAAFVPVSGYPMGDKSAYSSRPVPIMHVHGTSDDVCVFSGVQPTLDNWIARNECNSVAKVTKPYPAGKTGSAATMSVWDDGLNGTEVRLLQIEGKGHWQSEDPVSCLTSIEAWNFMQRWSLGPDSPRVAVMEPENGSFDLPLEGMNLSLVFDQEVSSDGMFANLTKGNISVNATDIKAEGNTLGMTFSVPEPGEYKLTLGDVAGAEGGKLKKYTALFTFGYEEVGEMPPFNVVFNPNLRTAQAEVGEGIPSGWHRINTRANGEKDEKGSRSANTGGARMKYFLQGGDFDEGFYLSARDYDRCEITYGKYTPDYALHFTPGKYVATFNSTFWNAGSRDGDVKFDFSIRRQNGDKVASFGSLSSVGNMDEQASRIDLSQAHSCEFEIAEEGDYQAVYGMSSGWAAVIVGNLCIQTAMSPAERYKGTFLRTLASAKALYASIPEESKGVEAAVSLFEVINRHEGLVSTAPSVYEKATADLEAAMAAAGSLAGVSRPDVDGAERMIFDLLGRPVKDSDMLNKGIYIINGKKIAK